MSNICAGIGRGQMEVLDSHISKRRDMNHFYQDIFKNNEAIKVFLEPNSDYFSNCWLSAISIDIFKNKGKTREDLRLHLEKHAIESRPLWKPMHLQPLFKDAPFYGSGVSETLFDNGLCLPSGSNLSQTEKNRIQEAVSLF